MLKISSNKFAVTYLSFVGGFLMIFVGQMVMAVDLPASAPIGEFTTPVVHSMDIAGGYNDNDNNGVSINNDGKFQIKTRTLGGLHLTPQYGLNINSDKGGLHVTSPYNPVAARNNVLLGKGNDPDTYGRVGIEGRVVGSETGAPDITKGFLGYVQYQAPNSLTEYEPVEAVSPDAVVPYAFYTTGNTYLGDTATFNDVIKNGTSGVTIAGDSVVQGNVNVDNNVETDVLNFSNVANLNNHFVIGDPDETYLATPSFGIPSGTIFPNSHSCAPDAYLVGCSGYVTGAENHAPYRGEKMTSASNKGGTCTAWAKSLGNSAQFSLSAIAYCFDPNPN